MHRNLNQTFNLIGSLLLVLSVATACEEPVDLGIGLVKRQLVISSNFLPDAPVTLKVSATRAPGTPYVAIENARVTLYEGPTLAATLMYRPAGEFGRTGAYHSGKFHPMVGKRYTIHVEAGDYESVTAVSSIPDPIPIYGLSVSDLMLHESGNQLLYDYRLHITYDDPVDTTNYYELRIYQEVFPFTVSAQGDTILKAAYLTSVDAVGVPDRAGMTVSYLLRDGGAQADVLLHLQSTIDARKELIGKIVAELRTVSPEYYFYQFSAQGAAVGPSGGLAEPVIYYNNVDRGVGIFAGYNSVQEFLPLLPN